MNKFSAGSVGAPSSRPCKICGTSGNRIIASETPCALWGDRPWMPEGHYTNVRCRNCGSHYVESDVTEGYLDELQATHIPENEGRVTYEASAQRDSVRTAELAEIWAMISRVKPPTRGDRLVDYGSAWGAFGSVAQRAGVIPNGIELQAAGAAFSRERWGAESVVHEGPIESAPWSAKSFDYVTSFETLEHVFDPIRILSHMQRLVKDDGVVAISVPSADYFEFKYWLYRRSPLSSWMMRNVSGNMDGRVLCHNHITTPSLNSVRLMMQKAGLKVVHAEPYCSGLSGGRVGRVLRLAGRALWPLSFRKIVFAPSIFAVAVKA
jgi:2-polyprenyl-3-methyl-5-hydroxy-6-metoxy-1,4-benzoquinol methylase